MELQKAKRVAERIVEILQPYCLKIHIAGSIRREKPEVKDIEIVCLPHKQDQGGSLFGEEMFVVSKNFKTAAASFIESVEKGNFEGRYMKIKIQKTDILLDLFMPEENDYYRQFCIRTGSREFSHRSIANAWIKKGWCGVNKLGLRKMADCRNVSMIGDKAEWELINNNPELPPVWESEEQFFDWLGIKWIEPKFRI